MIRLPVLPYPTSRKRSGESTYSRRNTRSLIQRMTAQQINAALDIQESYQMPDALMKKITGPDAEAFFDLFKNEDPATDYFRDYFQENQSNRDAMKQDYTPDPVCELVNKLAGNSENTLDLCSGTGALTVSSNWTGYHRCEEISQRALPVLLFNLAIRGISGTVANRDTITSETSRLWELKKGDKYSSITETDPAKDSRKYDKIISNPPYSLKIPNAKKYEHDERFCYGITPNGFSDYLFVEDAIYRLTDDGIAVFILPHGVLFRGNREESIRKTLLQANLIDAIIGLPDKMFLNTGIPVFIMILRKNRSQDNVLFIDASAEFEKHGKQNILTSEQIDKIVAAVKLRSDVDRYAHVATLAEIRDNDYNLDIPRYVSTYVPEPVEDLGELFKDIRKIDQKIQKTKEDLYKTMIGMTGTTEAAAKDLRTAMDYFKEDVYGSIKDTEVQTEGDSKDQPSNIGTDLSEGHKLDRALSNKRQGRNNRQGRPNRDEKCSNYPSNTDQSLLFPSGTGKSAATICLEVSDDD